MNIGTIQNAELLVGECFELKGMSSALTAQKRVMTFADVNLRRASESTIHDPNNLMIIIDIIVQ